MVDLYKNFDFNLLRDPDFREDSVREELVVPLLSALGYSASGPDRIIRGRPLTHPYVYIGTRKQPIRIIPDYLLQRGGENSWILDSKAPGERIDGGLNVEQAYSYAIHKDIRVPFYALCNGYDLAIYHISEWPAVFQTRLTDIARTEVWNLLLFLIGAHSAMPHGIPIGFRQDYGLHAMKTGLGGGEGRAEYHVFSSIPIGSVLKVEDSLYCLNAIYGENDEEFMVTFDFGPDLYEKLLEMLADECSEKIRSALSRQPFQIAFLPGECPDIGVVSVLGDRVHKNPNESYCPLLAQDFMQAEP